MSRQPDKRTHEGLLWCLIAVLTLALYCVITLQRWGVDLSRSPIHYERFGSWSEAITGVATMLAVFVALGTIYRDRLRERRAQEGRETELETSVYQWLTSKEIRGESSELIGRLWDLRIHNSTPSPIYRWRANFSSDNNHLCNYSKRPILPGDNILNAPFLDNLTPNVMPEVELIFEGKSSRIWLRSATGTLEEASIHVLECEHSSPTAQIQVIE